MPYALRMPDVSFLWCEVTGRCQLTCVHCYAESSPSGTHGAMTEADWVRVLDQASDLGVRMVQFIGGEPTLYPPLGVLVDRALALGLTVEVFSNLVHVPDALWEIFSRPGVSLATSYYSDDPTQHAAITGRPSHRPTKANIAEAVRRGIPVRAGVIDLGGEQRGTGARAELVDLGVPAIGFDRLRQVGRGIRDRQAGVEQLCGRCGDGVAAVSPDGAVWPCVFSRWLPIGNVLTAPLADVLASEAARDVRRQLAEHFASRQIPPCVPKMCDPQCGPSCGPACRPSCWPTGTGPCRPKGGCVPNYGKK
ncbi:radical SAM domain-containing protein [Candidatus Protofrankia californiensis]|uniref:Radical SAM domain-containing protein n=1 Tax=Candidatus Protofrankia californiensis TaxID=1839754 RepID=A0A1C3NVA2_9ACTN|nr:radical SAM domain-containing protein [Candidatus Protofrankia californiensis]